VRAALPAGATASEWLIRTPWRAEARRSHAAVLDARWAGVLPHGHGRGAGCEV
jgi:hypothetical protein